MSFLRFFSICMTLTFLGGTIGYHTFTWYDKYQSPVLGDYQSEHLQTTQIPDPFQTYKHPEHFYRIVIPDNWDIAEQENHRVVFSTPTEPYTLVVQSGSNTVEYLPPHTPSLYQHLLTQEPITTDIIDTVRNKYNTTIISGRTAPQYTEYVPEENNYYPALTTWLQHNNMNYYISIVQPEATSAAILAGYAQRHIPTMTIDDPQDACPRGWKHFTNHILDLCYPASMRPDPSSVRTALVLSGNNEVLTIQSDTREQWPMHICNGDRDVTVNGIPAVRTLFREVLASGCGPIIGFTTQPASTSPYQWSIGLYKTSGAYTGEDSMNVVESHLRIREQ
jgi:hypothetical protein